ncbi:protein disulfide isomerase-like 5-2 [Sesamum angolense]|uniref:Protein disulfide isomerase-like 5-2 n=1 Tax=Sesamum angolense TaxID=2727404 RepID=A0AAE2BJ28_9LAMI|nr:protein disulfide isomerase-like 5-2 [Sesamum angolense]
MELRGRLIDVLAKAAPILAGVKKPIVVAKVDADKHRELASKHHIHGYPTLKIFMRGVPTDYYGPRKADLLVRFLTKFVALDVAVLDSDSAIRDFVEAAGSNFPIFRRLWDFSDDIMTVYDVNKVPALAAIHPAYCEHSIFYGPFEEKLLEDYIKQSLLPLILPISQYSLKSLKDDHRKVVLTILEDETEETSKGLLKVLKTVASVNSDLIFGYVGFKQWEDFTKSFEVSKKSELPKMFVWDGNGDYYSVIGSESIDETNLGSQVSRFLKGYRDGSVIRKRIEGATFIEEPLIVGTRTRTREQVQEVTKSSSLPETRELLRPTVKED